MIRSFYKENIIKAFAAILTFGINNNYSFKNIEEHIIDSPLINGLENNEFNINSSLEDIVKSTFKVELTGKADISFRAFFLAESYIKLFFTINRSFEYIFLYWPLDEFVSKYGIYHEIDFSNLLEDFNQKVREIPLFKKLCANKKIKYTEITRLTGIGLQTLKKYASSDKFLYGANGQTIYSLASLLSVKINIFISSLNIYLDDYIYNLDKNNKMYRNYLGLYFAQYFIREINENDYQYSLEQDLFISKTNNCKLKTLFLNIEDITSESINRYDDKTYLIVFPSGYSYKSIKSYSFLQNCHIKEIMIVRQEETYLIKNNILYEITDTIYKFLIARAKQMTYE